MENPYKLKQLLAPTANLALTGFGKLTSRRHDLEKLILLCGVPRGGTTWLFEVLLNTVPGTCGLWEPLDLRGTPLLNRLNFSWRQHIDTDTRWPQAEDFFGHLFNGTNLNVSLIHPYGFFEFLKENVLSDRYLIKFCRANRLLMWMIRRFEIKNSILLIRHPCAVVASQLFHGGWNHVAREKEAEHPITDADFVQRNKWISDIIDKIRTPEEKLAITWCLDHYISLSEKKPYPWLLVSYERLVTDGPGEMQRIFDMIGCALPHNITKYLARPSKTTMQDSNVYRHTNPLATWKRRLSKDQQERILTIVSEFGLDFYTDSLEPDYGRLYTNPLKQ